MHKHNEYDTSFLRRRRVRWGPQPSSSSYLGAVRASALPRPRLRRPDGAVFARREPGRGRHFARGAREASFLLRGRRVVAHRAGLAVLRPARRVLARGANVARGRPRLLRFFARGAVLGSSARSHGSQVCPSGQGGHRTSFGARHPPPSPPKKNTLKIDFGRAANLTS
jgi:hypothetical protein